MHQCGKTVYNMFKMKTVKKLVYNKTTGIKQKCLQRVNSEGGANMRTKEEKKHTLSIIKYQIENLRPCFPPGVISLYEMADFT